jgi:hypothetical protein
MYQSTRTRTALLVAASILAIAMCLAMANSFAQDKPAAAAFAQPPSSPSEVTLPNWLEKLKLSVDQQRQARVIIHDYDADVAAVWRQFSEHYQQTVKIEAVLLTAIEDNLTEAQRKAARAARRKMAQRDRSPAGAADETAASFALTPEQEAAADRVNGKYLSRLRTLNRDIAALHSRLVSLEADKIVEIEKILTKPQLEQFSEIRQSAPLPPVPSADGAKSR